MSNLVGIDGRAAERPDEETIEFLEEILAIAKRGQIASIAAVWLRPDSTIVTGWRLGERKRSLELIGATTHLSNRMLYECIG